MVSTTRLVRREIPWEQRFKVGKALGARQFVEYHAHVMERIVVAGLCRFEQAVEHRTDFGSIDGVSKQKFFRGTAMVFARIVEKYNSF